MSGAAMWITQTQLENRTPSALSLTCLKDASKLLRHFKAIAGRPTTHIRRVILRLCSEPGCGFKEWWKIRFRRKGGHMNNAEHWTTTFDSMRCFVNMLVECIECAAGYSGIFGGRTAHLAWIRVAFRESGAARSNMTRLPRREVERRCRCFPLGWWHSSVCKRNF